MRIRLGEWRVAGTEGMMTGRESWPRVKWQGADIDFVEPVHLELLLRSEGESLFIKGDIKAVLGLSCSRCTDYFTMPFTVKMEESISFKEMGDEDYWALLYLDPEKDELDVGGLAMQVLMENLPLQPLCRPDCQGLCQECGQNLNKGSCKCREDQIDPRLAVLKKLLKKDG